MKTPVEDEQEGFYQLALWLNPHLWREILLNTPPNAGCEPFQDKRRRTYWLEVDPSEAGVMLIARCHGEKVTRSIVKWTGRG